MMRWLLYLMAIGACATSAFAQQISPVEWDDSSLVAARNDQVNLIGMGSGFESTGSPVGIRLPVLGLIPAELLPAFEVGGSGLEADGQNAVERLQVPTSKLHVFADQLGYSIPYQGLADGLMVLITADRKFRESPPGLVDVQTVGADSGADPGQEIQYAYAEVERFGVLYVAEVHCSSEAVLLFCKTPLFAQEILERVEILFPGVPE